MWWDDIGKLIADFLSQTLSRKKYISLHLKLKIEYCLIILENSITLVIRRYRV